MAFQNGSPVFNWVGGLQIVFHAISVEDTVILPYGVTQLCPHLVQEWGILEKLSAFSAVEFILTDNSKIGGGATPR